MSREISKRFAAIGDDLSPPKAKPALAPVPSRPPPKPREPVTVQARSIEQAQRELSEALKRGDPKMVAAVRHRLDELCREAMSTDRVAGSAYVDAQIEQRQRESYTRRRLFDELGTGIPTDEFEGIVQAEMEFEKARQLADRKQEAFWGERLAYIKYQARSKSSGVPMTASLAEYVSKIQTVPQRLMPMPYIDPSIPRTMDWAQQQIADVTGVNRLSGIVVTQEYDLVNDQLLICKRYPDGKVQIDKIPRWELQDRGDVLRMQDGSYRIPAGRGVVVK